MEFGLPDLSQLKCPAIRFGQKTFRMDRIREVNLSDFRSPVLPKQIIHHLVVDNEIVGRYGDYIEAETARDRLLEYLGWEVEAFNLDLPETAEHESPTDR